MATPSLRSLSLVTLILAGVQIGLPWALGGKSPAGEASLVLLIALAGAIGLTPGGPHLRLSPLFCLSGIFIGTSALHTIYPDRTVQSLLLLFSYCLAAALAAHAAREILWTAPILLASIGAAGTMVSLLGIFRLVAGHEGGLYAQVLTGPFGYPNAAAGFLVLTAGASLALARQDRGIASRSVGLAAAVLSIFGVVLTRSQGAMLAAAIGFTIWAAMDRNAWWPQRYKWAAGGSVGLLFVVALAPNRILSLPLRLWTLFGAGAADSSFTWRLHIWKWTLAMVRDHPWWGVGPGAFPVALTHYQRIPYVSGLNPHNLFLEIAAEYGLPLAILTVLVLGTFLRRLGSAIRRTAAKDPAGGAPAPNCVENTSPLSSQALAVLLATLVAFTVHSLVDLDWSFPAIAVTAAILLGLVSARLAQTRPRDNPIRPLWRGVALTFLLVMAILSLTRYYARSLANWAQLSLASQDAVLAQRDLAWALRLNPLSFLAHQSMAWARLRSSDPGGAIAVADRAARLAPLDPNAQFLAGEIAANAGRWDLAEERFRAAVDRSNSAQLRFHAGLVEAAVYGGKPADARTWYERATEIFTPERVVSEEARCLAPGDRYLLARLSRIVARLDGEAGDTSRQQMLAARARALAEPDHRGICITTGRPGQTSPEVVTESFWRALAEGGWSRAWQFLAPGSRHPEDRSLWAGWQVGEKPLHARVAWIAAFSGGEFRASLRFQLEIEESRGDVIARCAQSDTRLVAENWFLERPPVVQNGPCPE